ncbi:hypothetical protein GCM10027610_133660 [Dactylosporangium cerinum]
MPTSGNVVLEPVRGRFGVGDGLTDFDADGDVDADFDGDGEGDAEGDGDGDVEGFGHGPFSAMRSLAPVAL